MSAIALDPPQYQKVGSAAISCKDPKDFLYKIFRMTDTQESVNGKNEDWRLQMWDVRCEMWDSGFCLVP
jgi:hypothetical protein